MHTYSIEETTNTGVYQILNLVNNKSYVGSAALSFRKRWWQHTSDLNLNKHCNKHLQNAWNKYGYTNFIFVILESSLPSNCVEREQHYINNLLPAYNVCQTAGSQLGYKHSVLAKTKMSIAKTGYALTEEHKLKISESNKGRVCSEQTKQKLKKSWLGKPVSIETKERLQKLCESNKGRKHTEESRLKMSGDNHPTAKLNSVLVKEIRNLYSTGEYSLKELANMYKTAKQNISNIVNNKRWYDPTYTITYIPTYNKKVNKNHE